MIILQRETNYKEIELFIYLFILMNMEIVTIFETIKLG